jgi:predicted PurR-regulated permease PerM
MVETAEIQIESLRPASSAEPALPGPRRNWTQNLIGIGAILALCYYCETVLAVMLVAVLLSFVLAPIVDGLTRARLPRALAAGIAILLLLAAIVGVVYVSYNQAASLVDNLPKYTSKLREEAMRYRKKAESLEVLEPEHEKGVVSVRTATDWTGVLTHGVGSVSEAFLAGSFIPFLAYFMLTWQEHVRSATVMLFPMKSRNTAYVTLGLISAMIRSFMVGNLLIGIFLGAMTTVVFWLLHLPFFYIVGFISGFLSLVPYLGVLLAVAPPVFVGLGHVTSTELVYMIVAVLGLHVLALNVLYPKILGRRLQLNPLAVTMALLIWASLWGAIGLLLAIPITAAMKIIFDHVEPLKPYGVWLGE